MSSEAQVKNYFISKKSYVPFLRYSIYLIDLWFTKSVTALWVLVHETGWIFEDIFWTKTHSATKLGQLIEKSKENNLQKPFGQFSGLGLSFRSFSIKQPTPITLNQICQDSSVLFFEMVNKGQLKMVNVNNKKWPDLAILLF